MVWWPTVALNGQIARKKGATLWFGKIFSAKLEETNFSSCRPKAVELPTQDCAQFSGESVWIQRKTWPILNKSPRRTKIWGVNSRGNWCFEWKTNKHFDLPGDQEEKILTSDDPDVNANIVI